MEAFAADVQAAVGSSELTWWTEDAERLAHEAASSQLLKCQLLLLGRVVRAPDHNPMKVASFIPIFLEPATNRYVRRVGRPRFEWGPRMLKEAFRIAGGEREFVQKVQSPVA